MADPAGCDFASWTPLASLATATISVVVAAYAATRAHRSADAAHRNLVFTNQAQSGVTLSRCMDIYSKIEEDMLETRITGARYFERVWSLQFSQYHLFKLRLLPLEVYAAWLMARHRAYHTTPPVAILGMTQADGWVHADRMIDDPDFTSFVKSWLLDAGMTKLRLEGLVHTLRSRANARA
jgi:hypothetical protein